jgi:hypothetical protein
MKKVSSQREFINQHPYEDRATASLDQPTEIDKKTAHFGNAISPMSMPEKHEQALNESTNSPFSLGGGAPLDQQ